MATAKTTEAAPAAVEVAETTTADTSGADLLIATEAAIAADRAEAAQQSAAGFASAAKDDAASADRAAVLAGEKADLATKAASSAAEDSDAAEKASEAAQEAAAKVANALKNVSAVERTLPDDPLFVGENYQFTGSDVIALLGAMDAKARDQGHSLFAVLNKAASAFFGIDLSPDLVEPTEDAPEN